MPAGMMGRLLDSCMNSESAGCMFAAHRLPDALGAAVRVDTYAGTSRPAEGRGEAGEVHVRWDQRKVRLIVSSEVSSWRLPTIGLSLMLSARRIRRNMAVADQRALIGTITATPA